MSIETTATENKTEPIATQQEVTTTQKVVEVDYEAEIAKKDAEISQVLKEKENYRKAYLKKSGVDLPVDTQVDTENLEDMETIIDRKVQEKFLSTKEAQLQADKDALVQKTLKRNKELEVALKNRGQIISSTGQGSNQEKPEGKVDNYFSNDQIAALRAKGYDDKKIEQLKKNVAKVNEMPK